MGTRRRAGTHRRRQRGRSRQEPPALRVRELGRGTTPSAASCSRRERHPRPKANRTAYCTTCLRRAGKFAIATARTSPSESSKRAVIPLFGRRRARAGDASAHLLGQLIGLDYSDSRHVRGIRDDAREIRSRGFHAAAQMLRRIGARTWSSDRAVQLDDVHWADDGSLDFIDHLVHVNRDVPMLLAGVHPAGAVRAQSGGAGRGRRRVVTHRPSTPGQDWQPDARRRAVEETTRDPGCPERPGHGPRRRQSVLHGRVGQDACRAGRDCDVGRALDARCRPVWPSTCHRR